ncbi:hypothetical protein CONPUDRAFT_77189 [Coniophora puteana RWD-64-598 SS2]|uniref:Uncharacterized protein n=1 Tax=Coniophora puteana (strain RWD-64-598) TaxID=741705 RepID=A0A5M3M9P1_CONPW|nr:uncharacterized protein CONPUDRAFT_77189 [Coniophora puteana RWD-64-598 SS2]EIW75510.1 hypothetical protein CONPUDRAFT_77189 [Coniophora puteana RWD-64-598 SS2]
MSSSQEILNLTKASLYVKWTGCAASVLLIYDYLISFGDEFLISEQNSLHYCKKFPPPVIENAEVKSSPTQIRYGGIAQSVMKLLTISGLTSQWSDGSILLQFVEAFVVLLAAQAVVGLRVWYLFPRNKAVQAFSVATYTGCAVATTIVARQQYHFILIEISNPELTQSPRSLWTIYMPSLVVHTVFFFLKIVRLFVASEPVRQTFLSLFFKDWNIWSQWEAMLSVCRAMLHLRSLADTWHVEQSWLLNHAELSRVMGIAEKQGREIRVDLDA